MGRKYGRAPVLIPYGQQLALPRPKENTAVAVAAAAASRGFQRSTSIPWMTPHLGLHHLHPAPHYPCRLFTINRMRVRPPL